MFDNVTKENIKETNLNWPQISDHSYRILTNGGSNEMKYQFLINKREGADLILMILKLLLNFQMGDMIKILIFIKILKNTIQKNKKY